jgi:hypothetical protein
MNRLARMVRVASGLSLVLLLSNCSNFDPTDIMDNVFASQKKPLPGERKPLFPDGTPGVTQGLPPDLVKGYQPPPPSDATQDAQAAADKPKPKPKPKSQPKVTGTPPANQSSSSAMPAPAASRPAARQSSPWPDPPPPTQQSAAPNAGQTAWPDPPAPTTVTR